MSLESPRLDDRDFESLLADARRRAIHTCPEWTDHSPSDPGTVLLEVFAFLTDVMIYRLNRIPEKAYVEFLKLIGVQHQPPAAAATMLLFRRARETSHRIEIPRGTRVAVEGEAGGGVVFVTSQPATINADATEVEVLAHHCELVQGELVGEGTGRPGLSVQVRRPPIVAPTGDELDLVVGVEIRPDELDERIAALRHDGVTYRIWSEADDFSDLDVDRHVYVVDRVTGMISFAPALRRKRDNGSVSDLSEALAEVPPEGRKILVWYRRGGGPEGNVAAGSLTTLKSPIPGIEVTNPTPATGGRPTESLENALLRGPQELHSLERAVSARDFELLALRSSGAVARAKAVTMAELWKHAVPGTVEILLVPDVPETLRTGDQVTTALLHERETSAVVDQIAAALDPRKVLGTRVVIGWARYKKVAVKARVVVYSQEDPVAVEERVLRRLHRNLNPLPAETPTGSVDRYAGWPFGRTLRQSDVYDVILAEPGVSYVDQVRLLVHDVPDGEIPSIAADRFQERTWYAACRDTVFRSLNDGAGWEPAGRFRDQHVYQVAVHTDIAGLLAVVTRSDEGTAAGIHVSRDCGESWEAAGQLAFEVEGLTWVLQEGSPVLLLATDKGLYALPAKAGASPVQISVQPKDPDLGIYAVTATTHVDGSVNVAVAAQETGGVYLSIEAGSDGTFRDIGLKGQDVRSLAIQADGPRRFLWAGIAAAGDEDGRGCFSWELRGSEDPPEGWQTHAAGWKGGSCHDLAFRGSTVVAASHKQGVMRLASRTIESHWEPADVRSGLPLRDPGRFHPVRTVAVDPYGRTIMVGTPDGVFRSQDETEYVSVSTRDFDRVTLPPTWLFCSGEHEITVVTEDEARSY